MPCICHGADSGQEELDILKRSRPEVYKMLFEQVKLSASLVSCMKMDEESNRKEFNKIWVDCFDHMLNGCPERK